MAKQARPQLGFSEAIKLANSRLLDFSGRSRRSEFWWWMLLVLLASEIIPLLIFNQIANVIACIIIMLFGLSITVRRLHDTNHSAVWVYVSFAIGIFSHLYTVTSSYYERIMDIMLNEGFDPNKVLKAVDNNLSELGVIMTSNILWSIASIIVIVYCLRDSDQGENDYGESPKYFDV